MHGRYRERDIPRELVVLERDPLLLELERRESDEHLERHEREREYPEIDDQRLPEERNVVTNRRNRHRFTSNYNT